jgi:PPP family 3-phenylpropionic acid transporter
VFFFAGPWLVERFGPARTMAFAALMSALRWLVSALTLDLWTIVLIQPLHGITFALLHLACMRLLAVSVPPQLAATAQAIYGTLGIGATSAILTVLSGWLYAQMGGSAFLVMSGLCRRHCHSPCPCKNYSWTIRIIRLKQPAGIRACWSYSVANAARSSAP